MDNNKIIADLNVLLEKNYDAERGYKEAADDVKNASLKEFFINNSRQRNQFGHEIKEEIGILGGTPDKGGSLTGDLHRVWMDLKTSLSGNNEESVLEECKRGESAALADYEKIANKYELPPSTQKLVQAHRDKITEALRRVDTLEEMFD